MGQMLGDTAHRGLIEFAYLVLLSCILLNLQVVLACVLHSTLGGLLLHRMLLDLGAWRECLARFVRQLELFQVQLNSLCCSGCSHICPQSCFLMRSLACHFCCSSAYFPNRPWYVHSCATACRDHSLVICIAILTHYSDRIETRLRIIHHQTDATRYRGLPGARNY